jgi:deoxyribonuclease V
MRITPRSRDVLRCAAPAASTRRPPPSTETAVSNVAGDSAAGQRRMGLLPGDVPDLPAELQRLLEQIPAGRVSTYGDLARALGDVSAARWVGEYLREHPHEENCGCHRVVRKGGEVGLFVTGDPQEKIARLEAEGIAIDGDRAVLAGTLHTEFYCDGPLATLRELQQRLPERVEICPLEHEARTIGGIDVSYVSPREGVAAYVRVDAKTHELLWSTTVRGPVTFPYIPGYLTFRELPLFVHLFDEVRRARQEAPVTLVDGNGILHPRRAGSASAVGVAVGTPTIGISKKLLCGRVEVEGLSIGEPREVIHDEQRIGVAMQAGPGNRPFFASPGHRIDLPDAIALVQQVLGSGRLPVPIALADRISREEAQRIKAAASSS